MLTVKTLYETDFNRWLEETAILLREGKLERLDIENLLEEIEGMSRSEKSALRSNLEQVLMHLLKWKYQPSKRSNSWKRSIVEHSYRLIEAFEDSPSLKPYFGEVFNKCYQKARVLASTETGLSKQVFPEICPFSEDDVLNPEYLPE